MSDTYVRTAAVMGTVVTMQVIGHGGTPDQHRERVDAVTRAFAWFQHIEATCSRFEPDSELQRLLSHVGEPVVVSPLLYHAVAFALSVAGLADV